MDYGTLFFQLLLTGIFLSSLYTLMTFGLTLIFGVMEIVNFAHGTFAILGGYTCLMIATRLGMNRSGPHPRDCVHGRRRFSNLWTIDPVYL